MGIGFKLRLLCFWEIIRKLKIRKKQKLKHSSFDFGINYMGVNYYGLK